MNEKPCPEKERRYNIVCRSVALEPGFLGWNLGSRLTSCVMLGQGLTLLCLGFLSFKSGIETGTTSESCEQHVCYAQNSAWHRAST